MFQPIGKDILVERFVEEKLAVGDDLILHNVRVSERRGTVLAVGPFVEGIEVGDVVHLPVYQDRTIVIGGKILEIHPYDYILAKFV